MPTGKISNTRPPTNIEQQKYQVIVDLSGTRWFNEKGQLHRLDGPAVTLSNGDEYWYKNDKYHRDGGPACIWANGTVMYYTDGKLNRTDGQAVVYANTGSGHWFLDGKEYSESDFYKELCRRGEPVIAEGGQSVSRLVTSSQVGDRFTVRSMFLIQYDWSDEFEPHMLCMVGMQTNQCGITLVNLTTGNRWVNVVIPYVSASPASFLNSYTIADLRRLFHVGDQYQLIPLKSLTIST